MEAGERGGNAKVTGQVRDKKVRIRAAAVSKGGRKDYKRDVWDKQFIGKPSECASNIYHTLQGGTGLTSLVPSSHGWKVKRLD